MHQFDFIWQQSQVKIIIYSFCDGFHKRMIYIFTCNKVWKMTEINKYVFLFFHEAEVTHVFNKLLFLIAK